MKIILFLILFLSVILDYTLLPKIGFPFNYLEFLMLNFIFISLYKPEILFPSILIAGVSKDVLSSSLFGIYTLIFLIVALFVIITSPLMEKKNILTKIFYVSSATIIMHLIPNFVDYNLDLRIILKKGMVNSIFFLFWSKVLFRIFK